MALILSDYKDASQQLSWENLREKLNRDEALIEFVSFKLDFPVKTDSIMYVALLLRPQDTIPVMVPLFEEKQLTMAFFETGRNAPTLLYASRGANPVKTFNYSSIYNLLWKPLEPYLVNSAKVYMAATGVLHKLNLNAIEMPNGEILSDRYKLVQLGSTRQIYSNIIDKKYIKNAVLIGGVDYNFADTALVSTLNIKSDSGKIKSAVQTNSIIPAWSYLPGTENEVKEIAHLFQKHKLPVSVFQGTSATEQDIKQVGTINTSPSILHISTHGFFFPDMQFSNYDSTELNSYVSTFKYSKEPMLRSGLILAGANHSWLGESDSENTEDGILTAYEISQMNLSNTELVVLSACETGLGDIQGNEGVYGLQRAFKIAGAKYLIMSLWQVPDKQTSLLMTTFYKKWLVEKMTIPDAFHAAQKELRDNGLDPYNWAGFVLVE